MPDKPLRVLVLVHRQMDASPYCFFVHEQAKALAALEHDVQVVSCVPTPPMAKRLRPENAKVIATTPDAATYDGIRVEFPRCMTLGNAGERLLGGRMMAKAILPVAKRLHAERPFDIVHAHMLQSDGHAGLIVARQLGVPVALTVHGTDILRYFRPGEKPWPRNVRIARQVDALMAVSELLRARVAPYRGEGRITRIVQNGVDTSLIPERTRNTPRAVVSVGTLKPRKCMDRTLEAFARVSGDFPDATLTIVGTGEQEAMLRARVSTLGLEERVRITGGLPHEQTVALMAQSDLFVLPSWGEGFGVVYIEAMAAGCVAVGAKGEGIDGTIKDGENGLLVPAGDAGAVERAMRDFFANREKYAALRERGRQDARALTWALNARRTADVYREAVAAYAKGGKRHAR